MPKPPPRDFILFSPPLFLLPLLFLSVFSIYLHTLNPALFRNDSPETITACVTLGVSHPPGYPLHSLLGRIFSFLQLGNPAFTLNLLSGFLSSIGVCLFALNLRKLISILSPKMTAISNPLVTLTLFSGSLMFAFSNNYWSCSLAAKGGIYILQMDLELILLLSLLQLSQLRKNENASVRSVYFLSFLFSAGLINHWPSQALLIPGIFVFLKHYIPREKPTASILLKISCMIASFSLLVLSLYLYLPLRSNLFPELNFGSPNNAHRFTASVLRINYAKIETLFSAGPYALSTIGEKTSYITRHLLNEFHFTTWFIFLAGLFAIRKRKQITLLISIILATVTLVNLFYLQAMPIEFWHMNDHLLTLNWAFGLIASTGIFSILLWINRLSRPRFSSMARISFFIFLTAGIPALVFTHHLFVNNQQREFLYRGYGLTGFKSMERNSIYFAESDYDYFSMLYLKLVENKRRDITLFLTPFLEKPYEYGLIQKRCPDLSQNNPGLSGKTLSEDLLFNALKTGSFHRPFYCAFSNGPFVEMYLRHSPSFYFQPSGTLIKCMGSTQPQLVRNLVPVLNDFWERYLQLNKRSPNPINGFFLGMCSYPFTNAAYYLKMRRDLTYWDWFYERALSLIQIKDWLAQEWDKKGEGDLLSGKKGEALGAFVMSALEYLNAGEPEKSKASLQRALTIDPGNEKLQQILTNLGKTQ